MLYVEDNLDNLNWSRRSAERLPQVRLITATQGRLALELVQEHHPDLYPARPTPARYSRLGNITPLENRAGHKKYTGDLPQCKCPARSNCGTAGGGVRAYLTKPIDIREFLNVVEDFLWPKQRSLAAAPIAKSSPWRNKTCSIQP